MQPVDVRIKGIGVTTLIGIVSIYAGLYYNIYEICTADLIGIKVTSIIGNSIMIAMGAYLIYKHDTPASQMVPFIGIMIAQESIFTNIYPYGMYMNPMIFIEFLYLVVGLILIYLSIANMFLYRYYVVRIMNMTVVLFLLTLVVPFIQYEMYVPYIDIFIDYLYNIPNVVIYALFVYILTRDGIRFVPIMERLNNNITVLKGNMYTNGGEYIEPADMRYFISDDRSDWEHLDKGPVEFEKTVILRGVGINRQIRLQKWRGIDYLKIIVLPEGCSHLTEGFFFDAVQTIVNEDKSLLTFYDNQGQFMSINVRETIVKTKMEKITNSA